MSFEDIYSNNFDKVYNFLYYKCQNKSVVEDLVQETFFRFFKKYNSKDSNTSSKLLYGIAKNIYKEWVKQQIKENKVEYIDDYHYDFSFEEFNSPEFEQKIELMSEKVKIAVLKLSPNVRMVLELRFYEKLTRKEVALKMNISEKHVHVYQRRGIKYLTDIINKQKDSAMFPFTHK